MLKQLFTISALSAAIVGCGSDSSSSNNNSGTNNGGNSAVGYVADFTGAGKGANVTFPIVTGNLDVDYIVTENDLMSGSVSAQGQGLERSGFNYYHVAGNTLFSFSNTDNNVTSFTVVDGEVAKLSEVISDKDVATFGLLNETTLLATDAYWAGYNPLALMTFDATTGHKTSEFEYYIYENGAESGNTVAWPTAVVVRDDKLFIPFLRFDSQGNATTPDPENGYVAIFDYPLDDGAKPSKIIKDTRVSNLGTHGSKTALIQTESGDLYGYTNGTAAAGFSPASTKPSAIVKIAAGETEFDQDYFFNIEDATNGGRMFWFEYIGNNKALARIIERRTELVDHDQDATTPEIPLGDALDAIAWGDYYNAQSAYRHRLAIIDLEAKTVTNVQGVPAHWKRIVPQIEIMEGKVYTTITTAEGSSIYQIDLATGVGTKGATVEASSARQFNDLFN